MRGNEGKEGPGGGVLKLIVLWSGWCAVHSLLITTVVREWIQGKGGAWQGAYRLMYVGLAGITLVPVVWYTAALPQQPLPSPPFWGQVIRAGLLLYAAVLFIAGLRVYDLQAFLGLRQWRQFRLGRADAPPELNTGGILASLRHPWYSGGIALLAGLPGLTDVTLVTRLLLCGYLVFGAYLEERKMHRIFGEAYGAYCRRTPMFFPWRGWRRNQD